MSSHPNTFIDAELARSVMGWSVVHAGMEEEWMEKAAGNGARFPMFCYWTEGGSMVQMSYDSPTDTREFHPSSDDGHAVEVAKQLAKKEKCFFVIDIAADEYTVEIMKDGNVIAVETDFDKLAPAIAKASLKAIRVIQKGDPTLGQQRS